MISAIARKGIFDCLLEINKYITRNRVKKDDKPEEKEEVSDGVNKIWSPI